MTARKEDFIPMLFARRLELFQERIDFAMECRPEYAAMGKTEQGIERQRKISSAKDWFPNTAEDPGNPQNWPTAKKFYHTTIPISVAFLWCVLFPVVKCDHGLINDSALSVRASTHLVSAK